MVYGCARTATVISQKYSTVASIDKNSYKDLSIEFPLFTQEMKNQIYGYKDNMKLFMIKSITKIEYFRGISDDAMHDIIYSLSTKQYKKNDML